MLKTQVLKIEEADSSKKKIEAAAKLDVVYTIYLFRNIYVLYIIKPCLLWNIISFQSVLYMHITNIYIITTVVIASSSSSSSVWKKLIKMETRRWIKILWSYV
jgi:hypothetical protein